MAAAEESAEELAWMIKRGELRSPEMHCCSVSGLARVRGLVDRRYRHYLSPSTLHLEPSALMPLRPSRSHPVMTLWFISIGDALQSYLRARGQPGRSGQYEHHAAGPAMKASDQYLAAHNLAVVCDFVPIYAGVQRQQGC